MKRSIGFCFIALLSICGNRLWAQEQAPSGFPGQKLVDELFARHQPDLLYVGLYFVPPPSSTAASWPLANSSEQGGNEMVVVAATDRSTIGHKASCADIHVLTTEDSVLELNGDSGTKINGTVVGSTFLATLHMNYRDRSLGRNSAHIPEPVAVQHHVAHDQDGLQSGRSQHSVGHKQL